jgi:hypothetical protein
MRAPARTTTANPPIAMPTIAPVDIELLCSATGAGAADVVVAAGEDAVTAVGVTVAPVAVVVRVGATSLGKYSIGLNSSVAFCV